MPPVLKKSLRVFLIIYGCLLPVIVIVVSFLRHSAEFEDIARLPFVLVALAAAGVVLLYLLLFFAAFLCLWALFDLMRSEFKQKHNKVFWFILLLLLPLVGSLFYIFISPEQKINPENPEV